MNDSPDGPETPVPPIIGADASPQNQPETEISPAANESDAVETSVATRPWSFWLKKFLACNPSYLASAALLLYGCYRISADPTFLGRETAQLAFNFTSLQVYEILLVVTAIFLARRRVWYDSTLLVGLENLQVFVPFILISQAALIRPGLIWATCLAGGVLAVFRFGGLKCFLSQLNFPRRFLGIGLALLAANVALPVIYRLLHENKFGTKPDWGPAYEVNELAWLLFLPLLCGLANLLPPARRTGELLPQRAWLPLGLFSLWIVATGLHLYCLGYVYDFDLRTELLAPAVWILLWTGYRRATVDLPDLKLIWQRGLALAPLLATSLAWLEPRNEVFLTLMLMNAAGYGAMFARNRNRSFTLQLLLVSLAALIAGCPETWAHRLTANLGREQCIGFGVAAYFLILATRSSNPRLGLLGAVISGVGATFVLQAGANTIAWSLQTGFVFLMLHGLRWQEDEHPGARVATVVAGIAWAAHTVIWMRQGGAIWLPCAPALLVLVGYGFARWLWGRWSSPVIALATLTVMLAGPLEAGVEKTQSAPAGLLAIVGSFLLFGLGTAAALTRHHWHGGETQPARRL